ncbi:hypothetical protein Bca52824_023970 [Brassica carinata]|uniref:Uncharacterized protein n=1 Tax=Brassica carinata TaxID=52824 RepID=A0A8X8AV82_BRACI|nr:hypothetical protein Bca52824_023970 [Brassica carinata]
MFAVQLSTSAVTYLIVTTSSSRFAFAVETFHLAVIVSPPYPTVTASPERLFISATQPSSSGKSGSAQFQRWPNISACLSVATSPPAALLRLFSRPEQAITKRGCVSPLYRILYTSSRSPTQTHTFFWMFAVSVPSQGSIPRSPSHNNSYIIVSLASVVVSTVQECGFVRFTRSYATVAFPSHYAVSSINGSSQSQLRDFQTGTAFEKGQLAPPLPCVLIPTSRRNTPKSSARRLNCSETLCLIPDVCLFMLTQNECDDIMLWSISVTNYWLQHGNVEVRVPNQIR